MYEKPHLLNLPQEILESTLLLLDPVDVVSVIRTCKKLHSVVYNDRTDYMWRAMFLQLFDDPRLRAPHEPTQAEIDWKNLLQARIHAREVARSILPLSIPSQQAALSVLPRILADSARPVSFGSGGVIAVKRSKNVRFLEELLSSSERQAALLGSPMQPNRSPISSQLHTLYGLTTTDLVSPRLRGVAREKVYTMRNYSLANFWGPFLPAQGGARKPDWEMLECMMLVLGRNALDSKERWNLTGEDLPLMSLERNRPFTQMMAEEGKGVEGDWAGVQGRWYRIVSFMDYNDLWDWNWSGSGPKNLDDAFEVVKLMTLDLQVVSIGTPPEDATPDAHPPSSPDADTDSDDEDGEFHPPSSTGSLDSDAIEIFDEQEHGALHELIVTHGNEDDPGEHGEPAHEHDLMSDLAHIPHVHILHIPQITLHPGGFNMLSPSDTLPTARTKPFPTIYFTGTSSGHNMDPPVTRMRGRVDMTDDGQVVWRMTSRFSGHSWVSEGVQVGGVRSQGGVLAVWSELEHEEHGPAGPSWLWKSRSGIIAKERRDFMQF